MSKLVVSTSAPKADRINPKTGLNQAVLVSIVDIGTQPRPDYQGKPRNPQRQAVLTWALTSQSHVFDEEKGPEPLHVSRTYTLSLHEKSALRAAVRSMRGKDLEVGEEFDLMSLLGKNCMLNLVEVKRDENTYVNIDSISPLIEGMPEKDGYKLVGFSLADFKVEEYMGLHDWLKEKIKTTPEFEAVGEAASPAPETDASGNDNLPDHLQDEPMPF